MYGLISNAPVNEASPVNPDSPYQEAKVAREAILSLPLIRTISFEWPSHKFRVSGITVPRAFGYKFVYRRGDPVPWIRQIGIRV